MLAGLDDDQRQRARTLAFPTQDPTIAMVVVEGQHPPVQWSSRADGSFAVLDGELYNGAELGAKTPPDPPARDDASTILGLYLAGGRDALAQLDAAATITIWDASTESLLLYRDRSGLAPGFYAEHAGGVIWASDIETLLRTDLPREMNLRALDYFLAEGYVPAPWTFVEQVHKIPPAHVLICRRGSSPALERYWQPTGQPKLHLSAAETTERLGDLFEDALRRQHAPDVSAGALLSGGVDSMLIVGGLTKLLGASLDTFTFRYREYEGVLNEVQPARRAAEYFGTRHHEIEFGPSDVADNMEQMVRSYGEPFTYGLHSFMLRDVVDAGVSILFSGAGPDGWNLSRWQQYALRYAGLPTFLQRLGRSAVSPLRLAAADMAERADRVIAKAATRLAERFSGTNITPDGLRGSLYLDDRHATEGRRAALELFDSALEAVAGESDRDKLMFLGTTFFSAEHVLYWNHRWARSYGLAIRQPYTDNALLEFVIRLKRRYTDKGDLRRLAATLMPREMAYAPKVYQAVPLAEWLRGSLQELLRAHLTPERLRDGGLFKPEVVRQRLDEHARGEADHAWTLWAVLTVTVWQELVLGRGSISHDQ